MNRAFQVSRASVLVIAAAGLGRRIPLFSANYLPHRFCYLAQPGLIWTNVAADGLIAAAYGLLFACLIYLAWRLRRVEGSGVYLWILVSFGAFLVACGATHVMDVVTVWWPVYPFSAAVKVVCALTSVPTAALFLSKTPLLAKRTPAAMEAFATSQQERNEARAQLAMALEVLKRQRETEAELERVNQQLTHITDSTSEAILMVDREWVLQYANRRACELSPEIVLGKNFWELFRTLEGSVAEPYFRMAMDEHMETHFENFYEPYQLWFRISVHPTPGGISMFYVPITEEKRLEQQLVAERAMAFRQIDSVMNSTAEGIIRIGHDWRVLYGNRMAMEMCPDLIHGRTYWECFPAIQGPVSEEDLRKVMQGGKDAEWESFYERSQAWYAVHAYPDDGGLSLFFIPITRRKQLEQQVAEERVLRDRRIEALSVMAGGLAHEISNPLAIIHGTASDLQRAAQRGEAIPAEQVLEASISIAKTADRASRILRGLRGFARESGKDPMEYASIYDIVEEAMQMQETRFESHAIELRVDLEPDIPAFACRETQVVQIITNLLNNSYDAITQQDCDERWVAIQVSREEDEVQVDVVDSGLGIVEAARKHLMEPFFSTKTRSSEWAWG